MISVASRSTGTLVAAGSALLVAAALGRRYMHSSSSSSSSSGAGGGGKQSGGAPSSTDLVEIDDVENDDEDDGEYITPEDVVKIFDALFLHMQSVLAQLSQQIQQIQAAGQVIPEGQLRQLLKAEFERALTSRQGAVFEEHDVDEECLREATLEFLAMNDGGERHVKVRRSVERFQKLYENVSGESVVGATTGGGGKSTGAASDKVVPASEALTQEKLLRAASVYFDALTEAMGEIVQKFKGRGKNLSDPSTAQQLHMEFASVANDAGEAALGRMGVSLEAFRAAIERYSGSPEVGRTLTMLQMKQQQELMAMGVPAM